MTLSKQQNSEMDQHFKQLKCGDVSSADVVLSDSTMLALIKSPEEQKINVVTEYIKYFEEFQIDGIELTEVFLDRCFLLSESISERVHLLNIHHSLQDYCWSRGETDKYVKFVNGRLSDALDSTIAREKWSCITGLECLAFMYRKIDRSDDVKRCLSNSLKIAKSFAQREELEVCQFIYDCYMKKENEWQFRARLE